MVNIYTIEIYPQNTVTTISSLSLNYFLKRENRFNIIPRPDETSPIVWWSPDET